MVVGVRQSRRTRRAAVDVKSKVLGIATVKRVMMGEGRVREGGGGGDTGAYKCHVAAVIFLSGPVVVTLAFLSLLCYAE